MSRFEQIGSDRQYRAETVEQANIEMDISCYACCHHPRAGSLDCDHCWIRLAHKYQLALLQGEALRRVNSEEVA